MGGDLSLVEKYITPSGVQTSGAFAPPREKG